MTLNIKETIKNSNEFSKQNKPRSNSENFSLLGMIIHRLILMNYAFYFFIKFFRI